MTRPRRFYIETWGCQMNELDSQRMAGQLMQQGILPTREPGEADIILLNSCSVREKAEQKVYSRLGEYRLLKKGKGDLLIGLCGCVAQQEGERALERVPDLDFVLGPARVGELQEVVARRRAGERVVATGFPENRQYDIDAVSRHGEHKGMVTIIEGCNKNCTFCIVPKTRGPERSRPMAEILGEVRHLLDYGFQEIELLGQTVNHWREPGGDWDFADLLDRVARMPGLRRLRFITSYPRDFTPRMVEQVGKHANIAPYLHLPVQSGSDRVLRRMGRGYTRSEYLDLVGQLRRARTNLALSTDIIVGFPGETAEDFAQTLELVGEVRFAVVYAFKYSPRPGTAAPRLDGAVPAEIADERLQRLFALQEGIQREINEGLVGRDFEVIVTGWGKQP
ncbi:MAG TPA: tRNA (N6-isopentenyl adenosine(37)-C2)-methylthiotransferase MiaB, partial [Thermoanaerobaculia bacterium]